MLSETKLVGSFFTALAIIGLWLSDTTTTMYSVYGLQGPVATSARTTTTTVVTKIGWGRSNKRIESTTRLFAGIGSDGNDRPRNNNNNNNNNGNNSWDDFLYSNYKESDNLRKAREFMSENALPLSYDNQNEDDDNKQHEEEDDDDDDTNETLSIESSSALLISKSKVEDGNSNSIQPFVDGLAPEAIAKNPYVAIVSKITPSDLIAKFTTTAHPRVQNAVRTTILGMLGGLPKMAFETTTITTGQKLASLMFQLQMTGYMFKNAEYRLSLQQSLGLDEFASSLDTDHLLLKGSNVEERIDTLAGKVRGKIRLQYKPLSINGDDDNNADDESASGSSNSVNIEVDAAAYMSELRSEVAKLRDELVLAQKQKEESLNKDLLTYIRTLPPRELQSLTSTMSPDVVVAMKGLVNAVMAGIGDGKIGPNTVTEQSAEAMAQLCMWQLVIGYNLRTLEVREEIKKSLGSGVANKTDPDVDDSGVDFSQEGVLE